MTEEEVGVVGEDEKELVRLFVLGNEVAEITGYVGTMPGYWKVMLLIKSMKLGESV